jgi:hypothetical protein
MQGQAGLLHAEWKSGLTHGRQPAFNLARMNDGTPSSLPVL